MSARYHTNTNAFGGAPPLSGAAAHQTCGVVLCAGLGTRLRPATQSTPKPAVPFMGRPLAMHSALSMARAGIARFGVNVHYLPHRMMRALQPLQGRGQELTVSHEDGEILGTGGGVREIWRRVGTDRRLVVCHGDVVLGTELGEILASHQASGAVASLVLKVRDGSTSLRGAFTDATGRLAGILAHRRPGAIEPLVEHAFTGVQVLEPELYELLPDTGPYCLVSQLYPRLLAEGAPVGAILTTAYYADLGTNERFLEGQRLVFDAPGRLPGLSWPPERAPGVHVDDTVEIEDGAVLVGPVRIEGHVVVRSGAHVGPYVSLSGSVEVGSGSEVSNAAIWGAGTVSGRIVDALVDASAEGT